MEGCLMSMMVVRVEENANSPLVNGDVRLDNSTFQRG